MAIRTIKGQEAILKLRSDDWNNKYGFWYTVYYYSDSIVKEFKFNNVSYCEDTDQYTFQEYSMPEHYFKSLSSNLENKIAATLILNSSEILKYTIEDLTEYYS